MFAQMCQESPCPDNLVNIDVNEVLRMGINHNPGILNISPAISTIISAPQLTTISRICTLNPCGTPYAWASAENEYCVLAIQTE